MSFHFLTPEETSSQRYSLPLQIVTPRSKKMTMTLRSSNKILVQAAVVLLFFWVIALILLTRPLPNTPALQGDGGEDVLQRLSKAVAELESLKERNQELQWILSNFSREAGSGHLMGDVMARLRSTLEDKVPFMNGNKRTVQGPSKDYEVRRRAVYRGVQEMWYFVSQELEKLKAKGSDKSASQLMGLIQEVINSGTEHKA